MVAAVLVSALVLSSPAERSDATPARTQHSVALPLHAQVIGQMSPTQKVTLTAAFASQAHQQLKSFVAEVTNPSSPQFRRFLKPREFRTRFGAPLR
jgi:kumamolisin